MSRDFFVNGETMVSVKGNVNTSIGSITQLGLSDTQIRITPDFRHRDLIVDSFGPEVPVDVQSFLASVAVNMTLVHFDRDVLDTCLRESLGMSAIGAMPRAGTLLGSGDARFGGANKFIGLNLLSPVGNKPWRFYAAYLVGPPMEFPLGTEKSIVTLNWRCIPYAVDPWGGGTGSLNVLLWDHTLDT